MKTRQAFASSLKELRKARGMTQEDFSLISSRTYLSILERGLKSPTLEKIEAISDALKIHPMTLLALTFIRSKRSRDIDDLCRIIRYELSNID